VRPTRAVLVALAVLSATVAAGARTLPKTPFTQDPLGPLSDVTDHWTDFQPAIDFCVKPDVYQLTGKGPTVRGGDPTCAFSGFASSDRHLVKIHVETPTLCAGCRRLFIDYSKIPAANAPPLYFAHGHVYFHLQSLNPDYTVEPIAHSPNVKNFTNDKLVVPNGSLQEPLVWGFDLHAIAYTGNTAHVVYSKIQGPYYVGPWYVNRAGVRIAGAFLDVNVETDLGRLPVNRLNEIGYAAGFYSGANTCPNSTLAGGKYADGDAFYGGCVDHFGGSRDVIDPYH